LLIGDLQSTINNNQSTILNGVILDSCVSDILVDKAVNTHVDGVLFSRFWNPLTDIGLPA
jgi:hypothetical protein